MIGGHSRPGSDSILRQATVSKSLARVLTVMGVATAAALCGIALVGVGWLHWSVPAAATLVAFVLAGFVARRRDTSQN